MLTENVFYNIMGLQRGKEYKKQKIFMMFPVKVKQKQIMYREGGKKYEEKKYESS